MAAKKEITILERDPGLQVVLRTALAAELPGIAVRFDQQAGLPCFALYEKEGGVPAGIASQDAFEKPIRFGALIDRIRRVLSLRTEDSFISLGAYDLETADGTLTERKTGAELRLTEKENQLLKILHAADGAPVEKDVLLSAIWGYGADIETHTLETHIYRLRQKIEKNAAEPELLITLENGYALKA